MIKSNRLNDISTYRWNSFANTHDGETDKSELYFKSKTYALLSIEDLTDHDVNESFQNQLASFDEYTGTVAH